MKEQEFKLIGKLSSYYVQLKWASTQAEKSIVIKEAKTDKDYLNFLKFVLNPRVVTGISKAKLSRSIASVNDLRNIESTDSFFDICDYLTIHNTGRDIDIARVQMYIRDAQKCEEDDYTSFLEDVFTKNLKLGVEAKTVNKVLKMTVIPDWQVQQAYSIDKYKMKPNEWFSLSQKLNGIRCTVYNGRPFSRQGIEFTGINHILNELNKVFNLSCSVIDGELIRKNTDNLPDNENFTIGTGVINSNAEDKTCIEYVIFDVIPKDDFDGINKGDNKYQSRLKAIETYEKSIKDYGCKHIRIVPRFYQGTDTSQIDKWLNYACKHNMEGLMLNRDTDYRCTRHNGILKIKRFYTMDLPIIAVEEGENRLQGTLGALVVRYKDNEVRVGSGFDDETRAAVWASPNDYIGQFVEVKYKDFTRDKKTGKESLQFPVFVRFRTDKTEPSYD